MSGPSSGVHDTKQLLVPFAGLLGLSVLLQIVAIFLVLQISALRERDHLRLLVVDHQRVLVRQYEGSTYLAVVGLSVSDWEMLLQQRRVAKEVAARFEANSGALLRGGQAFVGERQAVAIVGIDDPVLAGLLEQVPRLHREMQAAQVRVLRSDSTSIREHPSLGELRSRASDLMKALDQISSRMDENAAERQSWSAQAQRLIPFGAFILTLILGGFVFQRLFVPLGASMETLRKSEEELRAARDDLEVRVAVRTAELAKSNEELRQAEQRLLEANDDLEQRVRGRTQELKEAQHRSIELARQAGMAEVATNVLHNVGNVLNSVTTSTAILAEKLRASRLEKLDKVAHMLGERRSDLAAFFTADERGRRLPDYVSQLTRHLLAERDEMLDVTDELHRNVDHIGRIVDLQQSYAKGATVLEVAPLADLVEDALRVSGPALGRHDVIVERRLEDVPPSLVDKHKVLQILLNLISNAKYALSQNPRDDRRLILTLERTAESFIRIEVSDNGAGIAPEDLGRIFRHGFTTREGGHGFGLHSSAIAARALGGALSVHSAGPGRGAKFTLELPYEKRHSRQR
jgi:two-component system NtrC family sensor kinase